MTFRILSDKLSIKSGIIDTLWVRELVELEVSFPKAVAASAAICQDRNSIVPTFVTGKENEVVILIAEVKEGRN